MKKLLSLILCSALAFATSAQTHINRNASEHLVRKVTTTDATATQASLVTLAADEIGTLTVKVVGFNASGVAAITGVKTYRYSKVAGVLTLGSALVNTSDAETVDAALSGATFAATAVSNNISVRVTGKAATTIYWKVIVKQNGVSKD